MFEIIRDAAKIGIGALSLSQENLKKFTDNLAELGKVSKEEGDRLFEEFSKASETQQKNLVETVERTAREIVDQMGLAPKTELEALKKRITELEALVKDMPRPEGQADQ